jgi:hypothetical protein
MKIDAYTKFLLTVITLCLLYLCANDLFRVPKVHADEPVHVVLVNDLDTPVTSITKLSTIKVEVVKMP